MEEGVSTHTLVRGFKLAARLAVEKIRSIAVEVEQAKTRYGIVFLGFLVIISLTSLTNYLAISEIYSKDALLPPCLPNLSITTRNFSLRWLLMLS